MQPEKVQSVLRRGCASLDVCVSCAADQSVLLAGIILTHKDLKPCVPLPRAVLLDIRTVEDIERAPLRMSQQVTSIPMYRALTVGSRPHVATAACCDVKVANRHLWVSETDTRPIP